MSLTNTTTAETSDYDELFGDLSPAAILYNLRVYIKNHIQVADEALAAPSLINRYDKTVGQKDVATQILTEMDRLGAIKFV